MSSEDRTEWPEVKATKKEYPSTTRNQDIVEDPEADITKVSSNIDHATMSYKARTGKRNYTKSLIDSGCNRHKFGSRELFQDFVETLIPIKTAGNTIYAVGVGTVGMLRGCLYVPNLPINLISPFEAMEDINGLKIDLELNKCVRRSGGENLNFNTPKGRQGVWAKRGTTQVPCEYLFRNIP